MEKILCKLTDENNRTYSNTQWGENVTHTSSGNGKLCSNGWLRYYDSPLLAVLLNPIHANFSNPILWEVTTTGKIKSDCGLKFGTTSLTTVKRIKLPIITSEQKTIFGILCAMSVYKDKKFCKWGEHWIDGTDRSESVAELAAESAESAAWSAESAARSAAWSAESAVWLAARSVAWLAAWSAAESAARSAESAARSAAESAELIDLHSLALKAISYK